MKAKKRLISIFLCIFMLVSVFPVTAFAAADGTGDTQIEEGTDVPAEPTEPTDPTEPPADPTPTDDPLAGLDEFLDELEEEIEEELEEEAEEEVYEPESQVYMPFDMTDGIYRLVGGESYVNSEGKVCYSAKTKELIYQPYGDEGIYRYAVDFEGLDEYLYNIVSAIGNGSLFLVENGKMEATYILPSTTEDVKKDLTGLMEEAMIGIDIVIAINPSTSKEAGMATANNTGLILPSWLTTFKIYLDGDVNIDLDHDGTPDFLEHDLEKNFVTVHVEDALDGSSGRLLADFGALGYRAFTITLLRDGSIEIIYETTVAATSQRGSRSSRSGGGMAVGVAPDGVYRVSNGRAMIMDGNSPVVILMYLDAQGYWIIHYMDGTNYKLTDNEIINAIKAGEPFEVRNGKIYVEPVAELTVEKTVTGPAPDGGYKAGDTISYQILVKNTGTADVTDITVTDSLDSSWSQTLASLAAGKEQKYSFSYQVTEADAAAFMVVNTATAKGTSEKGNVEASGEVSTPIGEVKAELTLTLSETSTPANGAGYTPGELITYRVQVANTGDVEISGIALSSTLVESYNGRLAGGTASLASGGSSYASAPSYTVLAQDVAKGSLENTVTVTGTDIFGNTVTASATATHKVSSDTVGKLTVTLTETSKAGDDGYQAGDLIDYQILVKNEGTAVVTDITVEDVLTGFSGTIDSLAPNGGEKAFTTSYTVGETDVENGSVTNSVTAKGTSNSQPVEGSSGDVTIAVGAENNDPVVLVLTETSTPANGEAYVVGETIEYSVTLINNSGKTFQGQIKDPSGERVASGNYGAGETKATFTYEVTADDVAKGSSLDMYVTIAVQALSGKIFTSNTVSSPIAAPEGAALSVTMAEDESQKPSNGYGEDDTITYKVTVNNIGAVDLTGIKVTVDKGDFTANDTIDLNQGASAELTVTYQVTVGDVTEGKVVNKAMASHAELDAPAESSEVETSVGEVTPDIGVELSVKGEPANGKAYVAGEKITYSVTVTNNTGAGTQVTMSGADGLPTDAIRLTPSGSGQSNTFEFEYTLTEDDVKGAEVVDGVSIFKMVVTATNRGTPYQSNEATCKVMMPEGAALSVAMAEDESQKPSNGYGEDNTITYKVTVTNIGGEDLTGITVTVAKGEIKENATIDLNQGASAELTVTYTVTAGDVVAGSVTNKAQATCSALTTPAESEPVEIVLASMDKNASIAFTTFRVSNQTSDGFGLNDEIQYQIQVQNDGDVTFNSISAISSLVDAGEWTWSRNNNFAPQATAYASYSSNLLSYTVKEADVLAGSVKNVITVIASDGDGDSWTFTGELETPIVDKGPSETPALTVSVDVTSTPENGTAYTAGESIEYTVTVTNTGNVDLENINVETTLGTLNPSAISSLTVNEGSATLAGNYTVLAEDEEEGSLLLKVTATCNATGSVESNEKAIPVGEEVSANASLSITIAAMGKTPTEANTDFRYRVTVKNDSTVPVTDITVTSSASNDASPQSINSLDAGATSGNLVFTYTVTETDLTDGLTVIVTATGTAEGIGSVSGENSNEFIKAATASLSLDDAEPIMEVPEPTVPNGSYRKTSEKSWSGPAALENMGGTWIVANTGIRVNGDIAAALSNGDVGSTLLIYNDSVVEQTVVTINPAPAPAPAAPTAPKKDDVVKELPVGTYTKTGDASLSGPNGEEAVMGEQWIFDGKEVSDGVASILNQILASLENVGDAANFDGVNITLIEAESEEDEENAEDEDADDADEADETEEPAESDEATEGETPADPETADEGEPPAVPESPDEGDKADEAETPAEPEKPADPTASPEPTPAPAPAEPAEAA